MTILAALAPVFVAIFAGWAARFSKLVPESAWAGVSKATYMILSPVFIFGEIVRADLALDDLAFVAAGVAGFSTAALLGFLLWPVSAGDRPAFASAHQGVVRWNTFVILAAAAALFGTEGAALIALLLGPVIPLINSITVTVHARYGHAQNPSLQGVLRSLATNPLILACVAGLAVNLSGVRLPAPVEDSVAIIGRGALGVSLMCVGAGLDLKAVSARPALMAAAVALKLAVVPLVFIGFGLLAGLDGVRLACLALIGAAPSPPAAYVLTREMGGDPRFMAGHITATTLLAALSLPLALALAQALAPS